MDRYQVTGMSCAACAARVEKAVSGVPGVEACAVNLLTNSMGVEGTAAAADIVAAVEKAGYGASLQNAQSGQSAEPGVPADTETPKIRRRLIISVILTAALVYVSMGHMMFSFSLPAFFEGNHMALGLCQLLLAGAVTVVNRHFFVSGFKSVLHGAPNMDTLVSMGAGVSFAWSVYVLFTMTRGDLPEQEMPQLYFESAAMILTLITVGKLLEARAKGKTTSALKSLLELTPQTAVVLRDGKEQTVPAADVKAGDLFVVRPGESIPADGIVTEGESAVNEAMLTGESIPVDKAPGDSVSAATINRSGFLVCRATRVGEDTALAGIIKTVSEASATKAPIARLADKVAGVFVPVVLGVAAVTFVVWLLSGQEVSFALRRGIAVLVISCPCALGLATPVAVTVGSGLGAKKGILFKTAQSLEQAGKTDVVVLDKTGTVTAGEPAVTDVLPAQGVSEETLLSLAAGMEQKSEHPLARAVVKYAAEQHRTPAKVSDFTALSGSGVSAVYEKKELLAGNYAFISSKTDVPEQMQASAEALANAGKTPLFFALDRQLLGVIAVADAVKEDSAEAVRQLKKLGMRVVMLTGDNERTAKAVCTAAGVDEVIADVKPEGKFDVIRELQKNGRVMMVGDGINDAPALTAADTGVAIGAGTDVAIDAADVVLTRSTLLDVPAAIRLSRQTLRRIRQNLFWAFFYNVIGIPLAAGVFIPLTGWELPPMFGAAAMSLSSFFVVSNALRLNLFDIRDPRHDKKRKPPKAAQIKEKGEPKMIITVVKIEGMMCPHCEAHVKEAIEKHFNTQSVTASHEKKEAVIVSAEAPDEKELAAVIEAAGYRFVGIGE